MRIIDVVFISLIALAFSGEEPKIVKSTIFNVPLSQAKLNEAATLLREGHNPRDPPPYFLGEFGVKASLGTPNQMIYLMLDSMHKYIWVSTDECANCVNPKFHSKSSSTFMDTNIRIDGISYDIADQSGGAFAVSAEDIFSVYGNNFPLRVKMAAVDYVYGDLMGTLWVHGSVGLNYRSFTDSYGYISQLIMQNKIISRIAGVYLGSNQREGELIAGGINNNLFEKIEYYHALDLNGRWEIRMNQIKYGDMVHNLLERRAVIELQIPFIIIPQNDFRPILEKLMSQHQQKCYSDPVTFIVWCQVKDKSLDQFSPLEMWIDSTHKFKIPPQNYIEIKEEGGIYKAMFRIITPVHAPFIGLGTPFIRSIYLVLDYDNEKIGIGIFRDSPEISSYGWVAVLIIVLVLILGAGGFLLFRKKRYGYFFKKPASSTSML